MWILLFLQITKQKINESERIDKYLDLAGEQEKNLCNMKATVIQILVGTFRTVSKNLEKKFDELEIRRIETIQKKTQLKSVIILRRVLQQCLVWFYGISTIIGYLMPNPLYTYISNIYDLVWFGLVWFYGISTIIGYLMPYPLYIYIRYI